MTRGEENESYMKAVYNLIIEVDYFLPFPPNARLHRKHTIQYVEDQTR